MEHPYAVASFLFCPVAIAGEVTPYPPLPIAAGDYGRMTLYLAAHQRVVMVTPTYRGITHASVVLVRGICS